MGCVPVYHLSAGASTPGPDRFHRPYCASFFKALSMLSVRDVYKRQLETCGGRSLLRLRLETGRTQQSRVHLCALGCPVAGDFLYGTELDDLPGRFALHLSLIHI